MKPDTASALAASLLSSLPAFCASLSASSTSFFKSSRSLFEWLFLYCLALSRALSTFLFAESRSLLESDGEDVDVVWCDEEEWEEDPFEVDFEVDVVC